MRRLNRIGIALGVLLGLTIPALPSVGAETKPKPTVESFGKGPAYDSLARLAVMHMGRVKPIDTLAREEIKQIYGRETIKLRNEDGEEVASWTPVAALLDWVARPEYWDDQRFINVEYLPLKRFILADSVKSQVAALSGRASAEDKPKFESLLKDPIVTASDLKALARSTSLAESDSKELLRISELLSEGQKWLSPEDLEHAEVTVDGKPMSFLVWLSSISERKEAVDPMSGKGADLTELERKAYEVGVQFASYRGLRDVAKEIRRPLLFLPHPSNTAFLSFTAEAMKKYQEQGRRALSLLELEAAFTLSKYLEQVARKDRATPGTDPAFDANYTAWLRDNSAWVPLAVMLDTKPDELAKAGYSPEKIAAFHTGFEGFKEAERKNPGRVDPAAASALVSAVRGLGTDLNPSAYPIEKVLNREVTFNAVGPFFWAPWIYMAGTILLMLSLAVPSSRSVVLRSIRKSLYVTGMVGFVGGIGIEVYGFSQRVMISGWAPVTNMYETVIWVGLVTAVIGLVMELIFRKTFAALAASGVATVCTLLAATVPLLDPKISALQPVLRSNLWLTIHVLTIVSSYAAFALSLGLGIIAMFYYLTAIYRRQANYLELVRWLPVSLVALIAGALGVQASSEGYPYGTWTNWVFYGSCVFVVVGLTLSVTYVTAVVGEFVSRRRLNYLIANELKPLPISGGAPDATATLEAETVNDAWRSVSKVDEMKLREMSMRETASKIKPLSNFVYRSMQVGVLLVAAGTILGGVWADYSWGRFWGWDAKEVWALITLLVYLVPLHGRFAGWVNTFGLVFFSVLCFMSVLMAWYGVNFVLGVGLHSYGFVEGGSQGSVGIVACAVLAVAIGVWWRRSYCNQPIQAA